MASVRLKSVSDWPWARDVGMLILLIYELTPARRGGALARGQERGDFDLAHVRAPRRVGGEVRARLRRVAGRVHLHLRRAHVIGVVRARADGVRLAAGDAQAEEQRVPLLLLGAGLR